MTEDKFLEKIVNLIDFVKFVSKWKTFLKWQMLTDYADKQIKEPHYLVMFGQRLIVSPDFFISNIELFSMYQGMFILTAVPDIEGYRPKTDISFKVNEDA